MQLKNIPLDSLEGAMLVHAVGLIMTYEGNKTPDEIVAGIYREVIKHSPHLQRTDGPRPWRDSDGRAFNYVDGKQTEPGGDPGVEIKAPQGMDSEQAYKLQQAAYNQIAGHGADAAELSLLKDQRQLLQNAIFEEQTKTPFSYDWETTQGKTNPSKCLTDEMLEALQKGGNVQDRTHIVWAGQFARRGDMVFTVSGPGVIASLFWSGGWTGVNVVIDGGRRKFVFENVYTKRRGPGVDGVNRCYKCDAVTGAGPTCYSCRQQDAEEAGKFPLNT